MGRNLGHKQFEKLLNGPWDAHAVGEESPSGSMCVPGAQERAEVEEARRIIDEPSI
tara:strand:- start:99 stop:266 length:168 start_codon:yes stop_codon:yes gene_type:complete